MSFFKKRGYSAILSDYSHDITDTSAVSEVPNYAESVLQRLDGVILADDFQILNYESAVSHNVEAINDVDDSFYEDWFVFAFSGQGDFWLIKKQEDTVGFYDHNQESTVLGNVVDLKINLTQWVVLGDLFHQFDLLHETNPAAFDKNFNLKQDYRDSFTKEVDSISAGLFERFPFNEI